MIFVRMSSYFLDMISVFMVCLLVAGSHMQTYGQKSSDCRVKTEDLKPLIQRFNPFFANHKWNNATRMEVASLGEHRLLMIRQDGCKRYHTTFTLVIDQSQVKRENSFWIDEVKSMMHKVFFEQETSYQEYGKPFEALFEEKFIRSGFNSAFNFPVGTRNFICNVNYHPEKEGRIHIEVVEYIFSEKVTKKRPQGIPREKDDGWKKSGGIDINKP